MRRRGSTSAAECDRGSSDLETTFASGRNFANKLWNIGRFILSSVPDRVAGDRTRDRPGRSSARRPLGSWRARQAAIAHGDAGDRRIPPLDNAAEVAFQLAWRDWPTGTCSRP